MPFKSINSLPRNIDSRQRDVEMGWLGPAQRYAKVRKGKDFDLVYWLRRREMESGRMEERKGGKVQDQASASIPLLTWRAAVSRSRVAISDFGLNLKKDFDRAQIRNSKFAIRNSLANAQTLCKAPCRPIKCGEYRDIWCLVDGSGPSLEWLQRYGSGRFCSCCVCRHRLFARWISPKQFHVAAP